LFSGNFDHFSGWCPRTATDVVDVYRFVLVS